MLDASEEILNFWTFGYIFTGDNFFEYTSDVPMVLMGQLEQFAPMTCQRLDFISTFSSRAFLCFTVLTGLTQIYPNII